MFWSWVQDYYSFVLSPFHDIITGHSEPFWRNLRLTDTLTKGGKELAVSNLKVLHNKRLQYLENNIKQMNLGTFITGDNCSYADMFIYSCVKTVQETGGFQILRDACQGHPLKIVLTYWKYAMKLPKTLLSLRLSVLNFKIALYKFNIFKTDNKL